MESGPDKIVPPFLKVQGLVDLRVFQVTKNITYPTHIKRGKGPRDKADNEKRKC